ncbi:MAG: hypothetical protein AB7I48_11260 [Planctomycetaceae bacterium]
MDAKEFLDCARDDGDIVRLFHFDRSGKSKGFGTALIVDDENRIAVMLGDCGTVDETKVKAGAIVKYAVHPEAESRLVGTPAYAVPTVIAGTRMP